MATHSCTLAGKNPMDRGAWWATVHRGAKSQIWRSTALGLWKVDKWSEVKVLVTWSCPTLFNPMYSSPPGFSVHGILQPKILEWLATPFSWGSSQSRDPTRVSCIAGRFFTIWATGKPDIPYKWNLKRNDTNELTYKTERDTDLENKLMVAGWCSVGRGS